MIQREVRPEIEAQVAAEAGACGITIACYLERIITDRIPCEPRTQAREEEISAAVDRIRELRKGSSLRGLTVKELVNEGRKY